MKNTKYIRYSAEGKTSYGILQDQTIQELHGDIFTGAEPTGKTLRLSDVKLLAPCQPSKVIAVGRNYTSHIADRNIAPPKEPGLFWKPSSCVIGTEEDIVLPEVADNTHYEAELVIVIGTRCKERISGRRFEVRFWRHRGANDVLRSVCLRCVTCISSQ